MSIGRQAVPTLYQEYYSTVSSLFQDLVRGRNSTRWAMEVHCSEEIDPMYFLYLQTMLMGREYLYPVLIQGCKEFQYFSGRLLEDFRLLTAIVEKHVGIFSVTGGEKSRQCSWRTTEMVVRMRCTIPQR
jgi:hypothetical protein